MARTVQGTNDYILNGKRNWLTVITAVRSDSRTDSRTDGYTTGRTGDIYTQLGATL